MMVSLVHHHLVSLPTDLLRLFVWLVILAAIFVPLERLFALRPQRILRRGVAVDLAFFFLSGLLPSVLLGAPLALLATLTSAIIPNAWRAFLDGLPFGVRLAAALVAAEIGSYWGHRLSHEIPLLWRFHSVHHRAEQIDWLVNTRAHPVDLVFVRLCGLAAVYALGLAHVSAAGPDFVAIAAALFGTVWGFFVHANVRWRFGPLERLIATPAFHHWHHTSGEHVDRNYAALFPWIDRLFGTLHLPRAAWPADYGVRKEVPQSYPLARTLSETGSPN